jgi:hypothetical protein
MAMSAVTSVCETVFFAAGSEGAAAFFTAELLMD